MTSKKEKQRPTTTSTKNKNMKNKSHPFNQQQHLQPGVFLLQKPAKKIAPRDQKPSLAPRPPKSNRSSVKSSSAGSRGRRKNSLESDMSSAVSYTHLTLPTKA